MATEWILVPCLVALKTEFDALGPERDRRSDGSIGDPAHAARPSSHNPDETGATPTEDTDSRNEVHALDVDDSGPWRPGFNFDDGIERIRRRCADGRETRLQNIIRNGRICSRTWGWTWRTYTGANPHHEHAHFEARYDTGLLEDDTRPWGLLDMEDDVNAKDVWTTDGLIPNPGWRPDGATNTHIAANTAMQVVMGESHQAHVKAGAADRKLDQVLVLLQALTGRDFTDEPAIVAGVLAGLDPAVIAAAIPQDLAQRVADELAARLQA